MLSGKEKKNENEKHDKNYQNNDGIWSRGTADVGLDKMKRNFQIVPTFKVVWKKSFKQGARVILVSCEFRMMRETRQETVCLGESRFVSSVR